MELYVSNLSYQVDDAAVREAFSRFGEVRKATVIKDRETGQSRGFAFVDMPDAEAGKKAINELHGTVLQGRPLGVTEARPRQPAGSGGYSGSNYAPRPSIGTPVDALSPAPRTTPSPYRSSYSSPAPYRSNAPPLHELKLDPVPDSPLGDTAEERSRRFARPPAPKPAFNDRKKTGRFEDGKAPKVIKGMDKTKKAVVIDDEDEFIPPVRIR